MDNHENEPTLHAASQEALLAEEHVKEVSIWMRDYIPFR